MKDSLRTKLIAVGSLAQLLVIIAMYFLEGEIYAIWFVFLLLFFFVFVFALKIAQKHRKIQSEESKGVRQLAELSTSCPMLQQRPVPYGSGQHQRYTIKWTVLNCLWQCKCGSKNSLCPNRFNLQQIGSAVLFLTKEINTV